MRRSHTIPHAMRLLASLLLCLLVFLPEARAQIASDEVPVRRGYVWVSGTDTLRITASGITKNGEPIEGAADFSGYDADEDGTFDVAAIPSLPPSRIAGGTFADGLVAESNVTQHQAALAIIESQITDLQHAPDLTTAGAGTLDIANAPAALSTDDEREAATSWSILHNAAGDYTLSSWPSGRQDVRVYFDGAGDLILNSPSTLGLSADGDGNYDETIYVEQRAASGAVAIGTPASGSVSGSCSGVDADGDWIALTALSATTWEVMRCGDLADSGGASSFDELSGEPTDNAPLAAALAEKQDSLAVTNAPDGYVLRVENPDGSSGTIVAEEVVTIPDPTGESGKVLSNDGTNLQWVADGGSGLACPTDHSCTWEDQGDGTQLYVATLNTDETAPAAPTGFGATSGDTEVVLAWTEAADADLANTVIERSTTSGSGFSQVQSVTAGTETWTDTGLANGTTYYYRARSADEVPNYSGYTSEVSATPTTAASGPPIADGGGTYTLRYTLDTSTTGQITGASLLTHNGATAKTWSVQSFTEPAVRLSVVDGTTHVVSETDEIGHFAFDPGFFPRRVEFRAITTGGGLGANVTVTVAAADLTSGGLGESTRITLTPGDSGFGDIQWVYDQGAGTISSGDDDTNIENYFSGDIWVAIDITDNGDGTFSFYVEKWDGSAWVNDHGSIAAATYDPALTIMGFSVSGTGPEWAEVRVYE